MAFAGILSQVKALVNEDTLLRTHCCPLCFLCCANWETSVADTKCFWPKSESFFVSQTQNLCWQQMLCAQANGKTFVSATMCPQQCVLVSQGLKVTLCSASYSACVVYMLYFNFSFGTKFFEPVQNFWTSSNFLDQFKFVNLSQSDFVFVFASNKKYFWNLRSSLHLHFTYPHLLFPPCSPNIPACIHFTSMLT